MKKMHLSEVTIPLKYLSNFRRILDLPQKNCEIEVDLLWSNNCVFAEHHNSITGVNCMITKTRLYVLVAILSINDNIKFLENIKQRFKRKIS